MKNKEYKMPGINTISINVQEYEYQLTINYTKKRLKTYLERAIQLSSGT